MDYFGTFSLTPQVFNEGDDPQEGWALGSFEAQDGSLSDGGTRLPQACYCVLGAGLGPPWKW